MEVCNRPLEQSDQHNAVEPRVERGQPNIALGGYDPRPECDIAEADVVRQHGSGEALDACIQTEDLGGVTTESCSAAELRQNGSDGEDEGEAALLEMEEEQAGTVPEEVRSIFSQHMRAHFRSHLSYSRCHTMRTLLCSTCFPNACRLRMGPPVKGWADCWKAGPES
jgi:hypothetical protein